MTPDPNLKIYPGRHVALELRYADGETERLELDVVPDSAADFERGFLGESAALAKAITGKQAGDVAYYPAGSEQVRVRILSVTAELRGAPEDLSARREAAERKAVRDAQDTDAILFASSFSGKWGDYDPNAVPKEDDQEDDESKGGSHAV